ncbi:MAG: hypothetical protein QNJ31_00965 [Candidatus Caenarcaniphilales bacterium]|nr:hypothetical protein [Candidatus Caenarcaniphilales bacterium]
MKTLLMLKTVFILCYLSSISSIAEQTVLPVEVQGQMIGRGLHSESSMQGDEVEVELLEPINLYNQRVFIPRNSVVVGKVLKVEESGRGLQKGKIRVVFDKIIYPNGFILGTESYISGSQNTRAETQKQQINGKANWKQKLLRAGKLTTGFVLGGPVGGAIAAGTLIFDKGGRIKIRPGDPVNIYVASIYFVEQRNNVEGKLIEKFNESPQTIKPALPMPKPLY